MSLVCSWIDPVGFTFGYDIALLRLEAPVNYTKWVKPICFPKYEVMGGDNIIMTGWGRTSKKIIVKGYLDMSKYRTR